MALPLRPRRVPQCSACVRSYAFAGLLDAAAPASSIQHQIRGKKRKMENNSANVTVKLLKDVKAYGRKGAIVPVARGQMRNDWFPGRIADYVTWPEIRTLRAKSVPMERDFSFGVVVATQELEAPLSTLDSSAPSRDAPSPPVIKPKAPEIEKLSPERSSELVEIFVPPRLEFYRQPIVEEKEPEETTAEKKRPQFKGAAGDLLAARASSAEAEKKKDKLQAIYGSVSIQDVLNAIRAMMANNDEAARVVLHENDIHFVGLPEVEDAEAGKLKHIGEFTFEVRMKGSDKVVKKTVKILPFED